MKNIEGEKLSIKKLLNRKLLKRKVILLLMDMIVM